MKYILVSLRTQDGEHSYNWHYGQTVENKRGLSDVYFLNIIWGKDVVKEHLVKDPYKTYLDLNYTHEEIIGYEEIALFEWNVLRKFGII
ncbi:hypothetical protein ACFL4H_00295 [Candidatus Neomarinimicrobiota bacterium]